MKKIQGNRLETLLFYLLILFLPTQLGKHFWPDFSFVTGIRIDYLSPTLYVTDILVGLLFSVWLFGKLKQLKSSYGEEKSFKQIGQTGKFTFLLVTLILIINILLSHHILGGYYALLKFFEFSFVAFYTASSLKDTRQFQAIVTLFSFGVIFESVLAFFQYMNQSSLGGLFYFLGERAFSSQTPGVANAAINGQLVVRPYGTFSHPNVLAGYLVIALTLIVFSFSSKTEIWKKVLFFLSFTFGAIALLLSLSRVAIVLWLVLFLISFATRLKKQEYKAFFLSAIIVIVFLGSIFLTPLFYRFSQTTTSEESFVQRETLMNAAAQMISAKPLLGVGLGNFLPTLATIQKPLSVVTYLQPVHNIFLLVAAETGVLGFAIFIFFLFQTYRRLFTNPLGKIFGIMVSAILILGFFDHYFLTLQQGQLLFSLVVGLCWSRIKG